MILSSRLGSRAGLPGILIRLITISSIARVPGMVNFDTSAQPVLAIDADMSPIEAQEWVSHQHQPLVILESQNGLPVQSVLVYEDSNGSVVLSNFWGVIDPGAAVQAARNVLNQSLCSRDSAVMSAGVRR